MSTFLDRFRTLVGPRGYEPCMRRSFQSVVLYEARRNVEAALPHLRPYQRKAVFLDQCYKIIDHLDFVAPHHRGEIMWRTSTSREPVDAETAHKRYQQLKKELDRISKLIEPFVEKGRDHQATVDLLEQHLFEASGEQGNYVGKKLPSQWGHAHNHALLCYRLYYSGDHLDPLFPEPVPYEMEIPTTRMPTTTTTTSSSTRRLPMGSTSSTTAAASSPARFLLESSDPTEERRRTLNEVREHLEILKDFEGVISAEELAERKRALFMALPPAPPPAAAPDAKQQPPGSSKKARVS